MDRDIVSERDSFRGSDPFENFPRTGISEKDFDRVSILEDADDPHGVTPVLFLFDKSVKTMAYGRQHVVNVLWSNAGRVLNAKLLYGDQYFAIEHR